MAQIHIAIDAEKIQRFFKDAPEKISAALGKVISKFAFLVEREAKMVTPVDTGRLRGSIATELMPLKATIAPHTNYAVYVHEGTRFMTARPFLRWGVENAQMGLDDIIDSELDVALK